MLAASPEEVHLAFPHFIVFEREPEWWQQANPEGGKSIQIHRLGDPLDSGLLKLCDEAKRHNIVGEIRR